MWPFKKKRTDYPELADELLRLCREWFEGQIGNLPADELPTEEEIEADILQMRNETLQRVLGAVRQQDFLARNGEPDDQANRRSLEQLLQRYEGHEKTTPVFTRLALSKFEEPLFKSGWPLCTIRLVAEAWVEDSAS